METIAKQSTLSVLRSTRKHILQQIAQHPARRDAPLRVIIDLTSLEIGNSACVSYQK
jgi:hypothetical protein